MTKKAIRDHMRHKLATSEKWAIHGLMRIYSFQTAQEQGNQTTIEHNGVGFTGADGEILSSFAEQYKVRGFLSGKQMEIVFKKMPKYWAQLLEISDKEKLEASISKTQTQLQLT